MISRYSRPEMNWIWSEECKFSIWLEIELHVLDALEKIGAIPNETAEEIRKRAKQISFDVDGIKRIRIIEKEVKHEMLAFLTYLSEALGPGGRFVHQGLTSSDVLDTCFNIQLVRSADLLLEGLGQLKEALKEQANKYKMTPIIGRSHGIHGEPTTFGLKLAGAYAEFDRNEQRLLAGRQEVSTCAISGAMGTFAHVDPRVEAYVAEKMNLLVEPVSTQVIPRDRHAVFFSVLGVIASSVERLACEVRHLQRTEISEIQEEFSSGQKGSSAMPHKRNPVLSENLTGLARIVRSYVIPAMENVALWNERDISHSSVERVIGPEATTILDFALHRLVNVMSNLVVYPDNMMRNLNYTSGLIHSQSLLLALTGKGVSREVAYRLVQSKAESVYADKQDFRLLIEQDPEISSLLSEFELTQIFEFRHYLKHVDTIFERVFGTSEMTPDRDET